jgi:DNA replication and repair protein RecF
MILSFLSVTGFRNIAALQADFSPAVNVFHGNNGVGKTNLLEAIAVLCLGRSQRGAADSVLLRNGDDHYRLTGVTDVDGRTFEVAVAAQKGGRKRITLNGVSAKASELYEHFSIVTSGPEDSQILSGSPGQRRTFLDFYLSQYSRAYLSLLTDYYRALAQKNAALRNRMDVSAFEPLVVQYGTEIMKVRHEFLNSLRGSAARHHAEIAGGELLELAYEPSVSIDSSSFDTEQIQERFEMTLATRREREIAVQTAIVGPHRDDIAFSIGGRPARTCGSQGQWRTAAIALKLAIYDILSARRRTPPLLLLDEIFAELDRGRGQGLVDVFGNLSQVFLTTAGEPPKALDRESKSFRISAGTIEAIA